MEISHIPVKFIFHSYSESSSFGSTRSWQIYPPHQWQFHRFLLYPESSYLADQVLADLPPVKWQFWQIPALLCELIFGRPGHGRSIPPSNGNFTYSCSDSSHFMTAHISFLLWELNIWQTRSWQIYPHLSGNFTDSYSDNSYFILTLRAYHLADQVLAYLPPHPIVISQIPVLTAHYSESSTFGRPVLGRCNPPHQMANSQIPALLWKLIYGRLSVGRSTPPSYGNFTDCCSDSSYFIPTLTAPHLADQVLADLPQIINGNLTDSYTSLRAQHLADQVLADLTPHIRWKFHRFLLWQFIFHSILWELNIWQTRSWQM